MYLLKAIVVAKGVGSLGGASSLLDEAPLCIQTGSLYILSYRVEVNRAEGCLFTYNMKGT